MRTRSLKYCIPVCALSIAVSGCSSDSLQLCNSHEMVFGVQMAGETKANVKGRQFVSDDLAALTEFNVTGYDGDNKTIDNKTLCKTNVADVWNFGENPQAWIDGHTMTFWSALNIPAYATATLVSKDSATLSVLAAQGGIQATVDKQCDPLIGYYSGTGVNGKATITFYHTMTAVAFKTGNLGDAKYNIARIDSVTMKNVHMCGSAAIKGVSPDTTIVVWTPSGKTNVSVSFDTATRASKQPFIIIPQNLKSDNVTLEVSVTLSSGGDPVKKYATLNSGSWEAGVTYIYTLDYLNDKIEPTLTVTLENWGKVHNTTLDTDYFDATFD